MQYRFSLQIQIHACNSLPLNSKAIAYFQPRPDLCLHNTNAVCIYITCTLLHKINQPCYAANC